MVRFGCRKKGIFDVLKVQTKGKQRCVGWDESVEVGRGEGGEGGEKARRGFF